MSLVSVDLWRFFDISRSCQKRSFFGSFERIAESILTVQWGTVGMLKSFLNQAVQTPDLSVLIAMRWPLQPARNGLLDSATVYTSFMVISWN